jgi:hypothetical protein
MPAEERVSVLKILFAHWGDKQLKVAPNVRETSERYPDTWELMKK